MDQKDEKLIQMPKLDKTSFNDWRDILTDVLESLKLAKFVEESSYVGTAEFSVDVLAKIARVKTIIKTSISIEDRQLIRSCSNPVEMLKELDQKYRGPCAKSAWELLVDWDDVTFDGSVSGLFSKLRELFVQFEEKDLVLPRYFINAKVRKLLPPEYDECRRLLMVYNGGRVESEYMTDKQFEAEILKFERDLKSKSLRDSTALVSVSKKKQYVFRGKCNFCGIPGHVSRDCRQKQKSSEKNAKSGKTECHSKSKQEKEHAELVISSALVKSASVPDSSIRFIADCGASYHVVNDKSILTNVRRTVGKINTISGIIEDPDQGDLLCEFFNGSFWRPCKVKDVFFVPDQPFNLVSLGKMCKNNGFRNVMDEEKLVIYNNNDPVLVGNWSKHYQNIMELQIRIKRSSIVNTAVVQSLSCWHERFGHFSAAQIAKMIRQNRVDGIPVKLQNDMGFCTSCQIGKATDVSHPLEDENENIKVGMKLHLDIGGYTTPSIHGNRYFLLAVDHRSRYLKLGFMKDRSHTLDLFKRIVNEIKLDTGTDVICIRSDSGSEFCSNAFQQFLTSHGIIHQRATVGTPQQNGRCERAMRTLLEHARSMLLSTDLPRTLWDEAVCCSAYVFNRMLNSRDEIPYEIFFGKRVDVSNLRVFGSRGEKLDKETGKLDPKTRTVRMVGYQGLSIYRVYIPDKHRIELASSVKFDEKPTCNVDSFVKSVSTSDTEDVLVDINVPIPSDGGHVSDNVTASRGRGRPVGSTNRVYQRNEERMASLRPRAMIGICAAGMEPSTYEEAIKSDEKDKWQEAMIKEYGQLLKHGTWRMVEKPVNCDIVSVKWIYVIKDDGRYKARLVARGFEQESSSLDVYAPVVHMDTILLFFAIVASFDMSLLQFDCANAFLNGDINEEVYIQQPPGFDDGTGRVCLLLKGLYGLRQSPRSWNKKFDDTIRDIGFQTSSFDPCFYFIKSGSEFTILCIYVDDVLLASNVPGRAEEIVDKIGETIELRKVNSSKFLGMQFIRNRESKTIVLHQHDYLLSKLKIFGMDQCSGVKTPLASGFDPYIDSPSNADFPYRQVVGALLYLSCKTRPDIVYAVSVLSRFISCTTDCHVVMAKRLLRYLNGTREYGIVFTGKMSDIVAYSDADLAGDKKNGRTTTGHVVFCAGPIVWRSRLQKCVIDNTAEAEFISAAVCSKDIRFVVNFLDEIGINHNVPVLNCDNQAAIRQMNSDNLSIKLRHINVKFLMIRDLITDGSLIVRWIKSGEQIADIFTKSLSCGSHYNLLICIVSKFNYVT